MPDLAVSQRNKASLNFNGINTSYSYNVHLNSNEFDGVIADDK